MNSTLKKLSNPNLSGQDLAKLLQKHIGDGTNQIHCHEAIVATCRIKNKNLRNQAEAIANLFNNNDGDFCETSLTIIALLKNTYKSL